MEKINKIRNPFKEKDFIDHLILLEQEIIDQKISKQTIKDLVDKY